MAAITDAQKAFSGSLIENKVPMFFSPLTGAICVVDHDTKEMALIGYIAPRMWQCREEELPSYRRWEQTTNKRVFGHFGYTVVDQRTEYTAKQAITLMRDWLVSQMGLPERVIVVQDEAMLESLKQLINELDDLIKKAD
jgi:hypothetical protein